MALPFIDRDSKKMKKYGKEAKDIVDQMNHCLRVLEGVLDYSSVHLDTISQKQITQLHTCCNDFRRDLETYRKVAEDIEQKGIKLERAQQGGVV